MAKISLDSLVVATEEQVHRRVDDEVVVLDVKGGRYYGLNEVGARIWEALGQPVTVATIRDALLREFDVDARRCENDLLEHLRQLADAGLIEVLR